MSAVAISCTPVASISACDLSTEKMAGISGVDSKEISWDNFKIRVLRSLKKSFDSRLTEKLLIDGECGSCVER